MSATWTGTQWSFGTLTSHTFGPAINEYGDMRSFASPRSEGDFIVAVDVTDLGGGVHRYNYAVYNHDSDRQMREFTIPVASGINVTNIGVRDADTDAGNQWTSSFANGKVSWFTQTHAQNPNANSLKYNSVFNFWFDANAAPVSGCALFNHFKPGSLQWLSAMTMTPPQGVAAPGSYNIVEGTQSGGNLASLAAPDGNSLVVWNLNEDYTPDTIVDVVGMVPCNEPSSLRFNLTSRHTRAPSNLQLQFWNFQTNAWEQVDFRVAPTSMATYQVNVTTNPIRFVGLNNEVRARMTWTLINEAVQGNDWFTHIDQATWEALP
jgi:hypothetical protein